MRRRKGGGGEGRQTEEYLSGECVDDVKVVLYSKKVMLGYRSHFFLNGKIVNFKHLGMLS